MSFECIFWDGCLFDILNLSQDTVSYHNSLSKLPFARHWVASNSPRLQDCCICHAYGSLPSSAAGKKNPPESNADPGSIPGPGRCVSIRLCNYTCDFPGGSDSKASAYNVGDPGSVPGSGRFPREGNGKPTPVFLPGKFHGWRSLVGYCPWGRKESDTTERLHSITSVGLISISGMAVTKDVKRWNLLPSTIQLVSLIVFYPPKSFSENINAFSHTL